MPAKGITIEVEGVQDLLRAYDGADKETKARVQSVLVRVGAPIARDAEGLALGRIRNMPTSPRWAKFRVGAVVTAKSKRGEAFIYIAPMARNIGGSPRPNLAPLLLERAMIPALKAHESEAIIKVDNALWHVAQKFNEGRTFTTIAAFGGGTMKRGSGGRFTGINR